MDKKDVFLNHYEFADIEKMLVSKHGEAFAAYREKFNRISDELLLNDIPMYIVLSVNSYCNLRCKMCLRNFQHTENDRLDLPLHIIKKITDECRQLGIPSIFLGATSECLLREDIREILFHIKNSGTMDNFLITNGTMLDQSLCDYLVDLEYERVYISLDAATPETYRAIRGADLNVVEKNINCLIETKKRKKSDFPVIRVSFVRQELNRKETELFIEKWKDKVEIIDIQNLIDYSGIDDLKDVDELEDRKFACPCPFRMLYIDYHGDIYPCASDFCYHMKIGNISEMSIKEAWNSDLMRELRASVLEGKLGKVCKNCANNVIDV